MILIFGGAYQGKLDYALETYNLKEKDVYICDGESLHIDFDQKIIAGLDKFTLACVREDMDARRCLADNLEKLKDKILIFNDISQGVVPIEKTERAWREANGRCMIDLAKEADEVIRVFCGIGTKIK